MAHCPFEKLSDLESELNEVRKLPSIKEAKPGIFYLKSQSFLHFHTKGDRRWADARDGKVWGSEIEIPFDSTRAQKAAFLKEVRRRHSVVFSK